MSLINDALKQAQADKLQNQPQYAPPIDTELEQLTGSGDPAYPDEADPSEPFDAPADLSALPRSKSHMVALVVIGLVGIALAAGWRYDALPFAPKKASARPTAVVAPHSTALAAQPLADARAATTQPAMDTENAPSDRSAAARPAPQLASVLSWAVDSLQTAQPRRQWMPLRAAGPTKAGGVAPAVAVPSATSATVAAATPPVVSAPKPAQPEVKFDPSACTITGVLAGPDGGTAIINGRFVRIGQTVDGAKLIRITPNGVELEANGRRYSLGM